MCVLVSGAEGGQKAKRVYVCLHMRVEQRIGWGLGVRVCANVRA